MNTFKAGQSITITGHTFATAICCRDTTPGKAYKLTHVGEGAVVGYPTEADQVIFVDDGGANVAIEYTEVTLVEGA